MCHIYTHKVLVVSEVRARDTRALHERPVVAALARASYTEEQTYSLPIVGKQYYNIHSQSGYLLS